MRPEPATAASVLWFIPTHGDGRYLGTTVGARETSLSYLRQIAQAVDELGYHGVLLPTGRSCEDSWVIASALLPLTQRLRFLVAVRPGLQQPSMAARMAATLDRISGGRLLINVVTGGDPVELKGDGIFLDHATRYAVTGEFLAIWRRLMAGETVSFAGQHLTVEDGRLFFPPVQRPYPRSISAAPRRPGCRSRPSTATCTSPGVSRRRRSGRSCAPHRRRHRPAAAGCASASGCT